MHSISLSDEHLRRECVLDFTDIEARRGPANSAHEVARESAPVAREAEAERRPTLAEILVALSALGQEWARFQRQFAVLRSRR